MGLLVSPHTGTSHTLSARTLVGRSPQCELVLHDGWVSGEHAMLRWLHGAWTVRDLGSRNGTWVQGERLHAGHERTLQPGDQLAFGQADQPWRLVDSGPPVARAYCPRLGLQCTEEDGLLLLPNPSQPEWSVCRQGTGWLAEGPEEVRSVANGDTLFAGDTLWRLLLPVQLPQTLRSEAAGPCLLHFRVSPDEEHVLIEIVEGERTTALRSQSFSYMLLTLARQRLAETDRPPEEQGWLHRDELTRMLRLGSTTVNVYVHRARAAFARVSPALGPRVIERRAGTGQLRLNLPVAAVLTG
jgi:hypothetical protein